MVPVNQSCIIPQGWQSSHMSCMSQNPEMSICAKASTKRFGRTGDLAMKYMRSFRTEAKTSPIGRNLYILRLTTVTTHPVKYMLLTKPSSRESMVQNYGIAQAFIKNQHDLGRELWRENWFPKPR